MNLSFDPPNIASKGMLALFIIVAGCLWMRSRYKGADLGVSVADKPQKLLEILVQALNDQDITRIHPYLEKSIQVGIFSNDTAADILQQVISNYPRHINSFYIISENKELDGTRIISLFKCSDGNIKYDFLITSKNKFKELNIVKIGQEFNPKKISIPPETEIPFRRIGNLIFVEGSVNEKAGLFFIDSGSDHMTLNKTYFEPDSAFASALSVEFNGAKLESGTTHVWEFRLKNMVMGDFDTSVQELSELEKAFGIKLLGIISQDQLSSFEIKFDFVLEQMILYALDALGNRVSRFGESDAIAEMPFDLVRHLPVIKINIGNEILEVAFDSGVSVDVFDSNLRKRWGEFSRFDGTREIMGANGIYTLGDVYILNNFYVSGIRHDEVSVAFIDFKGITESINYPLAGLVNYGLFKDTPFSINFRKRKIYLFRCSG